MESDSIKWYCMELKELYLILASMGVKKWYGFSCDENMMPVSLTDIVKTIAGLHQNEVITVHDDSIVICDKYKNMLEILKNSEFSIFSVNASKRNSSVITYFYGDHTVVIEPDIYEKGVIQIIDLDKDKWPRFILKECLSFDSVTCIDKPVSGDEETTLSGKARSTLEVASDNDVLSVFDKVDNISGETTERMTVRERDAKQFITYEHKGRSMVNVMRGGVSEVKHFLEKWI